MGKASQEDSGEQVIELVFLKVVLQPVVLQPVVLQLVESVYVLRRSVVGGKISA